MLDGAGIAGAGVDGVAVTDDGPGAPEVPAPPDVGAVDVGEPDAGGEPAEDVEGSAKASRFGDSVPGLVTTFVVAAPLIAFITCVGVACGLAERYRATRPAT